MLLSRMPLLKADQEKELSTKVFDLANVSYQVTSRIIKLSVYEFCSENKVMYKLLLKKAWLVITTGKAQNNRVLQSAMDYRALVKKEKKRKAKNFFGKFHQVILKTLKHHDSD